jgi:GIY-YIG catalytic domain-containing protein
MEPRQTQKEVNTPDAQASSDLVAPRRLWSREEVLARASPIPRAQGVYAWYFREIPPTVPTTGCIQHEDKTLLYVGISPSAPSTNGKAPSKQSLWHRIRYHYRGNAEGSTLRLTLGCLLAGKLGIELRRVGSGNRMTFGPGETKVTEWMDENAFVTWHVCEKPWELERALFTTISLPLNLDQNRSHPFHALLTELRRTQKQRARLMDVLT